VDKTKCPGVETFQF